MYPGQTTIRVQMHIASLGMHYDSLAWPPAIPQHAGLRTPVTIVLLLQKRGRSWYQYGTHLSVCVVQQCVHLLWVELEVVQGGQGGGDGSLAVLSAQPVERRPERQQGRRGYKFREMRGGSDEGLCPACWKEGGEAIGRRGYESRDSVGGSN
jgi:hypothetical protein